METVRLGRTGLTVGKVGFGALPIQRVDADEAKRILHRALDGGINFIDTARLYTDSEEKIGAALTPSLRKKVVLATKARLADAESFIRSLHTSLKTLRTDHVDILQVHNPPEMPVPGDETGCYDAMSEARRAGKIRFIGLTSHSARVAAAAAESGMYDTVQFPFSYLSGGRDTEIPALCRKADVGFLAMKSLAGGLIRDIPAAFAFMRRHDNVLPLWGIQRMEELEEFLALSASPPAWDARMEENVEKDRRELGGSFCRGCGYCLPCPAGIDIPFVARVELMLGRAPLMKVADAQGREKLARSSQCMRCGECALRCPYGLDTPELVRSNTAFFNEYMRGRDPV
jgi:aryl-alcohol dehydrogenase-like predicted oxidoreductase